MFSKDRVNKWLKNTGSMDEKVVELSNEATLYHDQIAKMIPALQKHVKDLTADKHPYVKCSTGIRGYKEGMVVKSLAAKVDKAGDAVDKMNEKTTNIGRNISNDIMAKCLSYKEVECRDIDQQMKQYAKVCKELENNKKKADKDANNNYLVDASQESLKKCTEETLATLAKFNKASVEVYNSTAKQFLKLMEAYCDDGARIMDV
ncbi:unnamed protein product [Caenorhabditis angaria]|uniref:BAR domain-containing protein n=1 Tax=Caenorhabditis angaria TaxID=860376 RepID=A0A9P1N941_9PELO|nr:unnamed protein product [Caenorhabditis angaria]